MKIMHLISGGDTGGAKTQVLTMLRELSKEHEATLVCFTEGEFAQDARQMGIRTRVVKGYPFSLRKKLLTGLRENGYELLHCHGAKANFYGAWLKKKLDIPVISTVHSDPKLDYMGRPTADLIYGNINRRCLRKLDGWVAVSDSMKELLIRRGFDGDRIWPIYNGIDFSEELSHWPRRAYLRRQGLDWDDECVVFGIAARFDPVKDLRTVISAFAKTVEETPNARLLIAGDGEQRKMLEELAAQTCPAGTVRFAGWQSDMNSFYHAVDVNLLSSISETFPYAITEGARMYCATIATAVGGVPRAVEDGVTGFLVEPGDWATMSVRMTELAQDTKLRHRLGISLHDKVQKEFSSGAMAENQTRIYRCVCSRYRRRKAGRCGVVVCGAYGRGNVGDEAILASIIRQLRQEDPYIPITVMSRNPEQTAIQTGVTAIHTFDLRKARYWMKRSSLYISGGGSLIQNVTSQRSLRYYLFSILQARKSGCKVMMYGCGIGPVRGRKNQHRVKAVLNKMVDLIALRDESSRKTLEMLGVDKPEIHVTADPAILTEANQAAARRYLSDNQLELGRKYAMFILRPWGNVQERLNAICGAADYVWENYGLLPVFTGLEPERDSEITCLAVEQVRVPCKILPPVSDGETLCGVMARMELVVSMRLHGLVFAAGQEIPAVGISYDPKVSGFMEVLGSGNCVELDWLSRKDLCQSIDKALSERSGLGDRIAGLQARAQVNGALAARYL